MAQPASLRQDHAASQEADRSMASTMVMPWPCVGQCRPQASGHAQPLRSIETGGRGRPLLPRPISESSATARTCSPKAPIRPARKFRTAIPSSPWPCSRSSAGTVISTIAEESATIEAHRGRQDELEDRPLRRHPARRHQARLCPLRQRQGPHRGLELPGPDSDPPRAALHQPSRSSGQVCDLQGSEDVPSCRPATQSIQKQDFSKDYPMILTSGRLVEYEGGGDESHAPTHGWLSFSRTCSWR